ncbi:PC4/YdbC family ssDNA-binding protein [Sporolactobacillus sp. CPB3-1]|uniref:PC4/YdbC family ssDNA-binding protein n=1 Tax=Sporolactobacillus mangiferae TaxID=2940498 RepID=A0ABT0M878_9BACL|nr:PC4/YdbC family ssDNA-binding protein [Sporolactobacillus mangiferae]MCL1631083.1 PC4/YdbC family ssDNA-binding protein [Sporolactobacillus mangiferae]
MADSNSEVTFSIVTHYGIIATENSGWTKELNLVSWNAREAKFDIRSWAPDKKKMGRGITLTNVECDTLRNLLNRHFPSSSTPQPQNSQPPQNTHQTLDIPLPTRPVQS